jgi:hypothetical protein
MQFYCFSTPQLLYVITAIIHEDHARARTHTHTFSNNDGYITFGSTFPNNRAHVMLAGGFGNLSAISIAFRSLAVELSF